MAEGLHKVTEFASEHPLATGVGVFVVGVIIVYWFFSGSSQPAANPADAYLQAEQTAAASAAAQQQTQAQESLGAQSISTQGSVASEQSANQLAAIQAYETAQTTAASDAEAVALAQSNNQASELSSYLATKTQLAGFRMFGSNFAPWNVTTTAGGGYSYSGSNPYSYGGSGRTSTGTIYQAQVARRIAQIKARPIAAAAVPATSASTRF